MTKTIALTWNGQRIATVPVANRTMRLSSSSSSKKRKRSGSSSKKKGAKRVKFRPFSSKTKTKTKKKSKTLDGQIGNLQTSFLRKHKGPRFGRKLIKWKEPAIYQNNSANRVLVGMGYQVVQDLFVLQAQSDVQAQFSYANRQALPRAPGGDTANIAAVSTKHYFHKVVNHLIATNSSNASANMTMYYYMARRDNTQTNLSTLWTSGLSKEDEYASIVPANGLAAVTTYVGSTPFQSQDAVTYYKIVGVKKWCLEPGQTITHNTTYECKRVLESALLNSTGWIRGFTLGVCVVVSGASVAVDTAASYAASYAPTEIAFVWTNRYTSYSVDTLPQRIMNIDTLDHSTTGSNIKLAPEFLAGATTLYSQL